MRDKTIRTVGSTLILLGVGVAALMQIDGAGEPIATSIVAEDTTTTTASVESAPSTTLAPEPFTYRLGVLEGVTTDNFWAFQGGDASVWNAYILGPTKPALFALSSSGELIPELAAMQAVPIQDSSGWVVDVELSDQFLWSDGERITADDIAFTFATVRELGLGGSWADGFPEPIDSVTATSDYELAIHFSEQPRLAVWPYGAGLAPVMPEHVWSGLIPGTTRDGLYQMDGSVDVAGGPLELTSVSDKLVVSEANPGYPASGRPDVVSYHVFENEQEAIDAIESDRIDTFLSPKGLTAEQVGVLASNPAITVQATPANGVRYLGFNLTRQPMADHAFRDALALVLDREELAVQTGTGGVAAYTFIGSANSRWQDETLAAAQTARYQESFSSRFAAAVAGLAEAGYSWESVPAIDESGSVVPGSELQIRGLKPAPLTILTSGDAYDPARPDYVEKIAETLGWFGFDVRPVETDFDSVVDLAFTPSEDGLIQYDMYLLGWTLGSPALPGYYRDLFATGGSMNNTGYSSGVFDGQLAEYEAATNQEQAHNSLWAMEKTLGIDLPYLLLYTSSINEAYRADRVAYGEIGLGGIQGRLGAIEVVKPVD